jgi:hypothetical protein
MEGIRWNDSDRAGTCALGDPSDGYFQFSFQDFPDLFLRVGMFVDRGPSVELIMSERHAGRIEIAASPARQAFDGWQFTGIDECHGPPLRLLFADFTPAGRG